LIEGPHGLVEVAERRVEVGAGLLQRRVTEHLLRVAARATRLRAGASPLPDGRRQVQTLMARYAASDSRLSFEALSRSNRISFSKSTRVDDRVLYLAFHQMYKGPETVATKSIVLGNFGGKATRAFTT
jgi:hypothetical protein